MNLGFFTFRRPLALVFWVPGLLMELLAQFVKDAFFLLVVMRIAVIVALVVFIVNAMKTPYMTELLKRLRDSRRNHGRNIKHA